MIIIITVATFASAVVATALLPFAKVAFPKSENFYVIYYGHLVDQNGNSTRQTNEILAANPELVIVPYSFPDGELNLTPHVHQQFSLAGIKVLTYTWTNYGSRDLNDVMSDIDAQMTSGVNGIFVDEVSNMQTNAERDYYGAVYKHIKSYGQDKIVIMNPGHYKVTESIMRVSDIVSLEEEWVYHGQITWMDRYPPSRFMGVSSNEYCIACVNESNASNKTVDAWSVGIGYHFATDRYTDLPSWFDSYVSQVKSGKN